MAAVLHDLGKIDVPAEILSKTKDRYEEALRLLTR